MLNVFEKLKYVVGVANKGYRKDMHYGFSIWRESCREMRLVGNRLECAFGRVVPGQLKRVYFGRWR